MDVVSEAKCDIEKFLQEKIEKSIKRANRPLRKGNISCRIEIKSINNTKQEAYWIDKLHHMYLSHCRFLGGFFSDNCASWKTSISRTLYNKLKSENGIHIMRGTLYHLINVGVAWISKEPIHNQTCYASVNISAEGEDNYSDKEIRLYDTDKEIITDLRTGRNSRRVKIQSDKKLYLNV